jgi:hypothetical protein
MNNKKTMQLRGEKASPEITALVKLNEDGKDIEA